VTSTDSGTHAAETGHDHDHEGGAELGVTIERLPGSQVSLRVEVPAASVEDAVDHAVRHLARRVRLPGFRPGKAPVPMVERAVGWPAVTRETLDEFVPAWYSAALSQGRIDAVGDPDLTLGDLERGAPFTFTATVTVTPEVELGDYTAIRVDEPRTEITDERVDEAIEEVRRRHGELTPVERPAEHGDVLRASMVMRRGGEVVGGSEEERDVELDRDRLLPGLADGLIGLEAGGAHTVAITLPDDYPQEEMRGVEVGVDVSVSAVRERTLPPLDDSLAALEGGSATLAEMRDRLRTRLEEQAAAEDAERFEAEVLERFRDSAVIDIPEVMVDREVDRQVRDMELRLAQMGMRLDRYLELSGETIEQVRGTRREGAVQRVKLELVLQALAEAEGLDIDEADVEREEARLAGDRKLGGDQQRRLHMAAHRDLLLRAAAQRAMEIARGE
jgi:trigger factor